MSELLVWPRMNRALAESKFLQVTLSSGPEVDLDLAAYDFNAVGERVDLKKINEVRDQLVSIAEKYGFRRRRGFDQELHRGHDAFRAFDKEMTESLRDLTPMNWAEAGAREVWSWFSLALLPDLTHWRWKTAVANKGGSRKGEWYQPRWVGSDLTRHTWSRYWWRNLQLESDPVVIQFLNEHEYNHFTERADSIGANPTLMTALARSLLELDRKLKGDDYVPRRYIFDESSKLILREMAFVDFACLSERETLEFVDGFVSRVESAYLEKRE